jgi:hypothetical protein
MPTCGNAEAITALPQPAKVSQNVPIASAVYFFAFISHPLVVVQMREMPEPEHETRDPVEVDSLPA